MAMEIEQAARLGSDLVEQARQDFGVEGDEVVLAHPGDRAKDPVANRRRLVVAGAAQLERQRRQSRRAASCRAPIVPPVAPRRRRRTPTSPRSACGRGRRTPRSDHSTPSTRTRSHRCCSRRLGPMLPLPVRVSTKRSTTCRDSVAAQETARSRSAAAAAVPVAPAPARPAGRRVAYPGDSAEVPGDRRRVARWIARPQPDRPGGRRRRHDGDGAGGQASEDQFTHSRQPLPTR